MKRKLYFTRLAAVLLLLLAASASATETFVASRCEKEGNLYDCEGEYLRLEEDGTGEGCYNGVVFSLSWERAGQAFSFYDEYDGSMTDGMYLGDTICGTYRSYTYTYVREEAQAPSTAPVPAQEPQTVDAGVSRTYYPVSGTKDGDDHNFSGEYIVLNPDGTGMVVYATCAYTLEWSGGEGEPFRFTDNKGNEFQGTLDGDTLEGTFHGYSYTLRMGDGAPMASLSPDTWGDGLPRVTDQAGILTGEEEEKLSARAAELSEAYGCNIYIVTLDDMENFSFSGKTGLWDEAGGFSTESASSKGELKPVETCAEEIRAGYDLGYGQGRDCILLLLSMAERDFDLIAFGDFGNASFTDYGKEYLQKRFLDDFKDNDWYDGFQDYVDTCGEMLKLSLEGKPVDVGSQPANLALSLGMSLLLGFLIALLICQLLKLSMRKTREKKEASGYIPAGGVSITTRSDRFIRTTETRVYDPPSKSSGGGGGTSFSSSGSSHSSGKF